MKKNYLPVLITLFISLLLPLIWFINGHIRGSGESGLPFYDLNLQYNLSKHSWSPALLGNARGLSLASVLTDAFLSYLQNQGIPNFIIEALFIGTLFFVAGVSIYYLTKLFFPKLATKYLLLSTLFYWFNPISLVNVWNRFLYNYMIFWALLPLSLFLFIKGIKNKKLIYSIMSALVSLIFSYALSSPAFNELLWLGYSFSFAFYFIVNRKSRVFLIKYFLLNVFFFIIVNFWWIGQVISFIYSNAYGSIVTQYFDFEGNLSSLRLIGDLLGLLRNNFIYQHGTFFISGPSWARYFNYFPVKIVSYLLTFIIIYSIYKYRRKKSIIFFALLYVFSLFLMTGSQLPLGFLFEFIFMKSTVVQVFRNPFEKFGYIFSLASAPLVSYGLYKIINKINGVIKRRTIFILCVLFIVLVWGLPFITGSIFKGRDPRQPGKLISNEVEVPIYYKAADDWLVNHGSGLRFISFPLGGEGIFYDWVHPYGGVELSGTIFHNSNISFNTTVPYFSEVVSGLEKSLLNDMNFYKIASLMNVKYIILREDIDWKYDSFRDPEIIKKFLDSKKEQYKYVGDFLNVYIYEITNNIKSKIWVSNNTVLIDPTPLVSDLSRFNLPNDTVLLSDNDQQIDIDSNINIVKQNQRMFLPKRESDDLSYEDLISKLLYARYLPGSKLYPLIQLKESIERFGLDTQVDRFIFDITHLGKRAVEISNLCRKNSDTKVLIDSIRRYENELIKFEKLYPEKFQNTIDNPHLSLMIDEFNKHYLLFQESQKNSTNENKHEMDKLVGFLNVKMIKYGFLEMYSSENTDSGIDRILYRFDVASDGIYTILMDSEKWNIYYKSKIKDMAVTLDGVKQIFKESEDNNMFILGDVDLKKGLHEITVEIPESVDLFSYIYKDSQIILDSVTNSSAEYKIENFDPFISYNIAFDYWIKNGDSLNYSLCHDNEYSNEEGCGSFVRTAHIDNYNHDFRNINFSYTPRAGASTMRLVFETKPYSDCEKVRRFP